MYSVLVAPATPVGMSALAISTQMRWPRRNRLAVARISTAYSVISPGLTFCCASRVKGCHGRHGLVRALIDGAMRRLEPTARQLAFVKIGRQLAFTLAARAYRWIRSNVLQGDEPVRVVLVDLGKQVEHRRACDENIRRKRIGHVPEPLHRIGLGGRHLHKRVGRKLVLGTRRREWRGLQPFPRLEIELRPLGFRKRPVGSDRATRLLPSPSSGQEARP